MADDDEREKPIRRDPYERHGWLFSGGLLSIRPVSEAFDRFLDFVTDKLRRPKRPQR
jgi:hypothetical protein